MFKILLTVILPTTMLIASEQPVNWKSLPPIPDQEGFAGSFAGIVDGKLLVAGGANFPDAKPWEGGTKVWYDKIFLLESPESTWQEIGKLPRPLGYGASITTPNGIILIGGSDSMSHHADVLRISSGKNGSLDFTDLPPLPKPLANFSAALLGTTIYIAGGIEAPDSNSASPSFFSLDLSDPQSGWKTETNPPFQPRILAAAGALDGSFFIVGGAALKPGADGKPERIPLKDTHRFTPGKGWKKLADAPRITVAAPSPMPTLGNTTLLLLGGDDSSQLSSPPDSHPGFPKAVHAYNTTTDTWRAFGEMPAALVTATAVDWNGNIVIPGGEIKPGTRSTIVLSGEILPHNKAVFGFWNYSALILYLIAMVAIGWYFARSNSDSDDYFTGGGTIPWWAAGISIFATMLSSLTFMSVPAKAFYTDWTFIWASSGIVLVAPLVIAIYLPFFRRLKVTSAYEYLEKRFNLAVRLYGSAAFVLFQLGRQAIVLLLPSLALATVSDLDVRLCIILMGALCVLYTVMGGIRAVIWTDVCQTVVLLGGGVLALIIVLLNIEGGISGLFTTASSAGKLHSINTTLDPSTAANAFWVIIVGNFFINLIPYTSDQTVVQRYMTTPDEKLAARSIWTNALLAIPGTILFFLIGTALFVFYKTHPEKLDPTQPEDAIFPAFILENMPLGLAGIVIAGIFAAAQSTVSSSLNSVSAVLTTDFWQRLSRTERTERQILRMARILTAVVGIFATGAALFLAELNLQNLWDAFNTFIGLAASGLAGLFALGIFSRRANAPGALIGAASSLLVLYLVQRHTDIHFFLYAAIGILTCTSVGYLASFLFKSNPPPASLTFRQPVSSLKNEI
jgi:SSS family solute:Na+ symporter